MRTMHRSVRALLAFAAVSSSLSHARAANEPVTFTNIAANDGAGITYRRKVSAGEALIKEFRTRPITLPEVEDAPTMGGGIPGVALADFNDDGTLDIYVTNGPGRANSLYLNHLSQGTPSFTDVAVAAGCDATVQDSSGVVVGDIDNDGWRDILVLGSRGHHNVLYHNRGSHHGVWLGCEDWTFLPGSDIAGGIAEDGQYFAHTSATLGDFDNDGLLDVAIATTWNEDETTQPIFLPFERRVRPNLLMMNRGGGVFEDVTQASGFDRVEGFADRNGPLVPGQTFTFLHSDLYETTATVPEHPNTISWAIAAVDMDVDGDIDIMHFDDEAGLIPAENGGTDYGFIQYFRNNGGSGSVPSFDNRTIEDGLRIYGAWMGGSFADFDFNGYLDVFATNYGAYGNDGFGPIVHPLLGNTETRALYQRPDGSFEDRGVGDAIKRSAFGWGTIAEDLDNDGDADVVYRGGLDVLPYIDMSNPNTFYYRNDGTGNFEMDFAAFGQIGDARRQVAGLAAGDLDNDGFVDVVSASMQDLPPGFEVTPYFFMEPIGAPLDPIAGQFLRMIPTDFEEPDPLKLILVPLYPEDVTPLEGTLTVEMNGGNSNRSVTVEVKGMIGKGHGHHRAGRVNRDGVGAMVYCTPEGGRTTMHPIVAGSSFASQDSTLVYCGLGTAKRATIEVRWPGGVRNRRYGVHAGSKLEFVEIPYGFDEPSIRQQEVRKYLATLVSERELGAGEAGQFYSSFVRARHER